MKKSEWQDAWKLADFYRQFKKRLQIRGYFLMFGYAVCIARVVQAPPETP